MAGRTRLAKAALVVLLAWAGMQWNTGTTLVTVSGPANGVLPVPFTPFGPYSTRANHGYEGANVMSPVVPSSYTAYFSPQTIGIQFIGDAPNHLSADHLSLLVTSPHGSIKTGPLFYQSTGFVGVHLLAALKPGHYRVVFKSPGFQTAQSVWGLTIYPLPKAQLAQERQALVTAQVPQYLAALNAVRTSLGESPVAWNNALAWAAASHALYVKDNGYDAPSFHLETTGHENFTGINPWDRDMAFGWQSPLDGEVGIEWTTSLPPVAVIQSLVDTVYHRLSLLSPNVVAVGAGQTTGSTGAVVMDLGYGYRAHLPLAIVYPASGQSGVPTGWTDMESPNPVPNGFSQEFGYPITVDFPTVQQLRQIRAQLIANGKTVPIYLDAPGVDDMADNQLGMVPRTRLEPGTTYTVKISGQALFNSEVRIPVALHWQFTTGGTDASVAVDPVHAGDLLVSVAQAGSGRPVPNDPVRIYQVEAGNRLTLAAQAVTHRNGIAVCHLAKPATRHLFEAVSGGETSMQFWW